MESLINRLSVSAPSPPFNRGIPRFCLLQIKGRGFAGASQAPRRNQSVCPHHIALVKRQVRSSSTGDLTRCRSSLESLFCYDKSVPEEIIEKPVGLSFEGKEIGNHPPCPHCETKGAVLCATCSGSGLYIDSIMESQGIIVKVRCLGCGGTGNIMCSECGGRGHT